jgi:integrase
MKIDAKTIAALMLPAGKTDHIEWDEDLTGFGLRLRQGGRRTWIVQYRASGRTRRTTIGSAEKVSPAQARDAARKLLARIELGGDPQGERDAKRAQAAITFRSVVASYLDAKQSELRPMSHRLAQLYLTGPYFSALQPLPITGIKRSDVAAAIRAIVRSHSTSTAAAARRRLSAFFTWVIAEGLLGDGANPVDGSHRPADPVSRERVLTDSEVVAIWKACGDDDYGRIIRLLALTGARRQEVGGIAASELDLDAGTWTLPAARSKNHRAHAIALPAPALEILKSVPRGEHDHLFGPWWENDKGFTSWSYGKVELDRRLAGAVRQWRVHDIRRTVATGMADIGIEPHVVEACLNHYSGHRKGPAGVYNRSKYERAVAAALVRWNEHLLALVEGRASKVVALPKSA